MAGQPDLAGGADTVHARHQHHIWQVAARLQHGDAVQGLAAVSGLTDHLDVRHLRQVG
jgi:hypothetical protein